MKKSIFTDEQMVHSMRSLDTSEPAKQLVRELGISEPPFYTWKKKYSGMGVPMMRWLV